MARPHESQWNMQCRLIQAVVIEVAVMIVQRLTMIRVEHNQCVFLKPQRLDICQEVRDTGIHIRNFAIVLRDDVVLVGTARREPTGVEIAEGLERIDWVQRMIVRV